MTSIEAEVTEAAAGPSITTLPLLPSPLIKALDFRSVGNHLENWNHYRPYHVSRGYQTGLKITEKVSFNIASGANYVYKTVSKMPKMVNYGEFLKMKYSNETVHEIFKQCACGWCWAVASPSRWTRRTSGQWACQWYTITNSVFYLGPLSPAELFLTAGAKNFTVIFFHKCRINSPQVLIVGLVWKTIFSLEILEKFP